MSNITKRRTSAKARAEEESKQYVDVKHPKCQGCSHDLRLVVPPRKLKCDNCGYVYMINQYTGEIVNRFKSLVPKK